MGLKNPVLYGKETITKAVAYPQNIIQHVAYASPRLDTLRYKKG
jgi:hypothetical protein